MHVYVLTQDMEFKMVFSSQGKALAALQRRYDTVRFVGIAVHWRVAVEYHAVDHNGEVVVFFIHTVQINEDTSYVPRW